MDEEEILEQEEEVSGQEQLTSAAQNQFNNWRQRNMSESITNAFKPRANRIAAGGATTNGAAAGGATTNGAAAGGATTGGAAAGGATAGLSAGTWVIIIIALLIIFIVIIMILFQTGFIYTNSDYENVASAYNDGVTITDVNGENAITISIEDYVKGAVYAQIGDYEDTSEYIKALSVVIRNYGVINYESISNDEAGSLYKANYSNNSNISSNVNKTKGEYLHSNDEIYSIDINTIDKEQMKSLALSGQTYKEILAYLYGDNVVIDTVALVNTEGLQQDENNFYMRLGKPLRTNAIYYEQDADNYGRYYEGECAAYATCRAQEILASINSSKTWNANVNGGNYCNTSDAKKFMTSINYNEPKVGAIVSWQKNGARSGQGHVAIVEKVVNDKVTISETFNNLGSLGNSYIRAHGSSESRKKNCLKNGCFRTYELSINQMKNYKGAYTFQCYIYLVEE